MSTERLRKFKGKDGSWPPENLEEFLDSLNFAAKYSLEKTMTCDRCAHLKKIQDILGQERDALQSEVHKLENNINEVCAINARLEAIARAAKYLTDKTFVGDVESADELVKLLASYYAHKAEWLPGGMHTNGGPDPWPNDSAEILAEARRLAGDLSAHAIWHRGGEIVSRLVARIRHLEYGQVGKVPS